MTQSIIGFLDRLITRGALLLACFLLIGLVGLVLYHCATRWLGWPSWWWHELSVKLALLWIVSLGLGSALRRGALLAVDCLYRLSSGWFRELIHAFVTAISLVFLSAVAWFGIDTIAATRGQLLAGSALPSVLAYAAIPTGCTLALIAVLAHYYNPQYSALESVQ